MDIILYSEINIYSIVILLIIALKLSASEAELSFPQKLFSLSVWFVLAANVFDFLWNVSITKYWTLPLPLILGINFLYFMCFGLSSYFWYLYSKTLVKKEIFERKGLVILETLPLVLLAALLIASLFNGCLFYFDENMGYHRGPLYYLQAILSYGYICVASVNNLMELRKKKNFAHREQFLIVTSFAFPILLCGVIQIFLQGAPVMTLGLSVSFLLVYISSIQVLISVDSLTNISNRRELLRYLNEKMPAVKENERLYFLFMDIDSFKQINDRYGHSEGDKALKAVASILRSVCHQTNGLCARYGGDEFAVVQVLEQGEDIGAVVRSIYDLVEAKNKEQSLPYSISISIGYSVYPEQAGTMDELISCADKYMYNVKMKKAKK